MPKREIIIKESHRGLRYENGVFKEVMAPGRYELPPIQTFFGPKTTVEIVQVDVRERELTIKGQEILTADKVAIRVSIIVQFQVRDPAAAVNKVQNYEERIYSDVQLAARRSLASMTLDEILTNRNRLSEEILRDVKESAGSFGIAILRADVKDLVFPGNLQEIMNRVLAAERMSQAQLVEARTKAEMQRIEAETRAHAQRQEVEVRNEEIKQRAEAEAQAQRIRSEAQTLEWQQREKSAKILDDHPVLLRLRELEALSELALNSGARLYIGFDKHTPLARSEPNEE
jgi:regulator of protease activity HflC (stomatin/prohibitin superfamily)